MLIGYLKLVAVFIICRNLTLLTFIYSFVLQNQEIYIIYLYRGILYLIIIMARTMQTSRRSTAIYVPRLMSSVFRTNQPIKHISSPQSPKTKPIQKKNKCKPTKIAPKVKSPAQLPSKYIPQKGQRTPHNIKPSKVNAKSNGQKAKTTEKIKTFGIQVKNMQSIEPKPSTKKPFVDKIKQQYKTSRSNVSPKRHSQNKYKSSSKHKTLKKPQSSTSRQSNNKNNSIQRQKMLKISTKKANKVSKIKSEKQKLTNNKQKQQKEKSKLESAEGQSKNMELKEAKKARAKNSRALRLQARQKLKQQMIDSEKLSIQQITQKQIEQSQDKIVNKVFSGGITKNISENQKIIRKALEQYQINDSQFQQQIQYEDNDLQTQKDIKLNRLFLIQIQKTDNSWTFKTMNIKKQLFTTRISLYCSCSCLSVGPGCKHLNYIIVNISKCQKVYEQLKEKSELSQVAYFRLNMCLKIALHCRIMVERRPQLEAFSQICYICMEDICKDNGKLITNCASCSRIFHRSCVYFWNSLALQLCPLCNQKFYSHQAKQLIHIEEFDQIDEVKEQQ